MTRKTLNDWFEEYDASHQHPTNKAIHWLCVPTILLAILGILTHYSLVITIIALAIMLVFYSRLDVKLALMMAAICMSLVMLMWWFSIQVEIYFALFVLAWIGRFIGHQIEGKKPSFFKDLQFLLIGPAWCLNYYTKGLRSKSLG